MIEILMDAASMWWANCADIEAKHGGEWDGLTVRQVVLRIGKIYSEDEYHDIVPDMAHMHIVARLNGVARRYRVKPSLYYRVTKFSGSLDRGTWRTVTAGDCSAAGNSGTNTTAKSMAQNWVATRPGSFAEGESVKVTLIRDGGGGATCTVRREHGIKIQDVSLPIARYAAPVRPPAGK